MTRAKGIVLEVLAPRGYYSLSDVDLPALENQFNDEVASFANRSAASVSLSFRFRAFPPDFVYQPGVDCELIRDAIRHRASPFAGASEPLRVSRLNKEGVRTVEIRGYGERQIDSFTDGLNTRWLRIGGRFIGKRAEARSNLVGVGRATARRRCRWIYFNFLSLMKEQSARSFRVE